MIADSVEQRSRKVLLTTEYDNDRYVFVSLTSVDAMG